MAFGGGWLGMTERCVPICFSGRNYLAENAVRNKEDAAHLLLECPGDIGQS